jgi:hypothetical protein
LLRPARLSAALLRATLLLTALLLIALLLLAARLVPAGLRELRAAGACAGAQDRRRRHQGCELRRRRRRRDYGDRCHAGVEPAEASTCQRIDDRTSWTRHGHIAWTARPTTGTTRRARPSRRIAYGRRGALVPTTTLASTLSASPLIEGRRTARRGR